MTTNYDIIVFGCTGYAGKYVVEHLANPKNDTEGVTWAVAARNAAKIVETLEMVGKWVDKDLSHVEQIIADVSDEESLNAMCKRARVLINCVGPYNMYGEVVVKAAINNNCDHIDLSGEDLYLKSTMLNYHDLARKSKSYVIEACGFDSAVCDMGIEFLTRSSPYLLNGITCYLVPHCPSIEINYGTWHSLVNGVHDWRHIGALKEKLFPKKLPNYQYKLSKAPLKYHQSPHFNRWSIYVPAGDLEIARTTQYYKFSEEHKRPIQIEYYMCAERYRQIFGVMSTVSMVGALGFFQKGRDLLLKYPGFFSFGTFHHEGPPRETILNRTFEMYFEGEAFEAPSDYSEIENVPKTKPEKRVTARVSGPDPGYITCSTFLVQAAISLVKDRKDLPTDGGVFTPASALANTRYIERLQKNGITFEMV